jgi:hypothetical protein
MEIFNMSLLDTGESLSPELLDSCGWKQISQSMRQKYAFIPRELGGVNFEGSIYIHRYKPMLSKNITKTQSHIEWCICDVLIGCKTCFVLSAGSMHPKLISVWFVWVPQYKLVHYVEDLNDVNVFIHNTGLIEDEKLYLGNH